jgi:hypothetical protein
VASAHNFNHSYPPSLEYSPPTYPRHLNRRQSAARLGYESIFIFSYSYSFHCLTLTSGRPPEPAWNRTVRP